jgi:hypothetical protein
MDMMGIESSGVSVVVVDDRDAETIFESSAEIKAVPVRVDEVRRPGRRNDSIGARRTRSPETDSSNQSRLHPGKGEHIFECGDERFDGYDGSILNPAGVLDQSVDQEAPGVVEDRRRVTGAAVIKTGDDP